MKHPPARPGVSGAQDQDPTATSAPRRWSRGRLILFRLLALLLGVAVLGLVELALRLGGVGYSTGFFLKTRREGRAVFVENPSFSKRFFPPGLQRTSQTLVVPTPKPPNTTRIFIFGESAALGDPEPAYGFSRILEVMLRQAWRGRKVEVINVALTAVNSHVVRDIAKDCADKEGDYWIVYLGNNEVIGPYGAGTVFNESVPPLAILRAGLGLKRTRLGQALDGLLGSIGGADTAPAEWEGMRMFLERTVGTHDPRLERVYDYFALNLRDILETGKRSGAKVLLATVAVNLRDCPPFASAGATSNDTVRLRPQPKPRPDEGSAVDHFVRGRAQLQAGLTNEARASLVRALDLDLLRFRADSRINDVIRTVAREVRDVDLIDVFEKLAGQSPGGIPGEEFFHEHVHFNFAGNHAVARMFAERILPGTNWIHLPGEAECRQWLAYTPLDQYRVLDEVRQRLLQAPFTNQLNHVERMERVRRHLSGLESSSLVESRREYERAIALWPDDWVLRENFATLLLDFGETDSALHHWKRMFALVPHSADACHGIASTLEAMGRPADAALWFRQALRRSPDWIEARHSLALALLASGRPEQAVSELRAVVRRRPDLLEARLNLVTALGRSGRTRDAVDEVNKVLTVEPGNERARRLLKELEGRSGR